MLFKGGGSQQLPNTTFNNQSYHNNAEQHLQQYETQIAQHYPQYTDNLNASAAELVNDAAHASHLMATMTMNMSNGDNNMLPIQQ